MNFFAALNALFLLVAPANSADEAQITPVNFRIRTYSYGTYYGQPYTCPHGYTYGPGYYSYRRGFRVYSPGYFGTYRYGCYDDAGRAHRPAYSYPRYRYYRY